MSEKTEKASSFKLKKAKEQGQVSKSIDLNTNLSLLIILGLITALWPKTLTEIQSLMRALLISSGTITLSLDSSQQLFTLILNTLCGLWLPFALAATLSIILSSIAQTGLIWSSKPLLPDFKRISRGYKKVLSVKTMYDAFKTLFKLSTALLVLYLLIKKHILEVLPLQLKQPKNILTFMMHFLSNIMLQLLLVLIIFAVFDLLYTRWKYYKDQGMSKQELKEEHKQRDGDPKVKSKIKQIQMQLRQKTNSLKQIASADVVVCQPSLAIALKYDPKTMSAPQVVCKAQGEMAIQVLKLAKKHSILIVENHSFAEKLYKTVALNQTINSDLFASAATIYKEIL